MREATEKSNSGSQYSVPLRARNVADSPFSGTVSETHSMENPMNDHNSYLSDEQLQCTISAMMGQEALRDDELDSLLDLTLPTMMLSDEQTQRIVGKLNRLLNPLL